MAESLFHADAIVAVLADHGIEALAAPNIQYGTGLHPSSATEPVRFWFTKMMSTAMRAAMKQNIEDAADMDEDEQSAATDLHDVSASIVPHRMAIPILGKLGVHRGGNTYHHHDHRPAVILFQH